MTQRAGGPQLDKEARPSLREEHGSGPGLGERVVRSRHCLQSSRAGTQRRSRPGEQRGAGVSRPVNSGSPSCGGEAPEISMHADVVARLTAFWGTVEGESGSRGCCWSDPAA